MSFTMYLIGLILVVIGLAYGASLANVPPHWIAVGVIAMLGLGIMSAVSKTRQRDPS
jgi:hypothetical protein